MLKSPANGWRHSSDLGRGDVRVLLTTARALLEQTQLPARWRTRGSSCEKATPGVRKTSPAHLESIGFERTTMVDDVAQFSVRGGIFDIYGFGMAEPVRLEFWGDEIVELRHFDLVSQRSTQRRRARARFFR